MAEQHEDDEAAVAEVAEWAHRLLTRGTWTAADSALTDDIEDDRRVATVGTMTVRRPSGLGYPDAVFLATLTSGQTFRITIKED